MQALSLIPEKLRQRRRLRQRVLDTVSPRTAFANPKYGSTSRNFIFRVMASRKIAPSPMPGAAVVPKVNVDETSEEETWPQIHAGDGDLEFYSDKPETPCQKIYQRACARLQVLPSMSVYHHLPRSHMTLPHCGVGQDEVKALAIALVNLSHNAIATEGVRLVTETLLSNTSIVRVNLAGNNIQDKDAVHFFQMLKKNKTLRELNLSHNHLCLEGGILLGEALSVNSTLRILDLSWNHLRLEGAVSVCRGLATNDGLTRLFLAWNGLAMEGCNELGKALCRNTSLVELDVSANRISGAACRRLLAGLRSNATLRCLRIGTNPITTEGALSILLMLADDVTGLTELDLTVQRTSLRSLKQTRADDARFR
ncbi:hypothetical protein C0Q70_06020 [Pomacea canaliculata]|uniref:Uncharacterized protein n=1 Tax=Pomacea canaliculata TaxID=400727 RepID=A0A2T7PMV1_POMCA|nr:hypothetical protein C0Q70_06020 [Pomacea canaliculata]